MVSNELLGAGAIAGIAIGAVATVALLAMGAWLVWRKKAKTKQQWVPESDTKLNGQGEELARLNTQAHGNGMNDGTGAQELSGGQISPKEMQGADGFAKSPPVELEGSVR